MKSHMYSAVLALVALAGPVFADVVSLKDGRVIDGEVMSQPGDTEVTVNTRVGGITATLHFKATDVVSITYGKTDTQRQQEAFAAKQKAFAALDAKSPQSAAACWVLAEEAKRIGDRTAYRKLAQTAIERDENFAPARIALGYVQQNGQWMKPTEAAIARGEVLFRGRWMPVAERDAIVAEEERLAQESAERAKREQEVRLAKIELEKAEVELRTAKQAAEVVQPVYSTYTTGSYYDGGWGNTGCAGGIYVNPGWNNNVIIRPPVIVRPPMVPCNNNGLQIHAGGQGNGYNWNLNYR